MTTIASLVLAVSLAAPGGLFSKHAGTGRILPPGPGWGWGFPNGNPDGYGWADYGTYLPLGGDRTPDYYFPRYLATVPEYMYFPTYFNPYVMRGQRYVAYTGCGGKHPFGGPAPATAVTSMHPYQQAIQQRPVVSPPVFNGNVGAPPVPVGGSGLIP
jgi:hypothetical protein